MSRLGQAGNEYLYTIVIAILVILLVGFSLWDLEITGFTLHRKVNMDPESFQIKDYRFSSSDSANPDSFEIVFLCRARTPVNVTGMKILSEGMLCNQTGPESFSNEWVEYGKKFSAGGVFTDCKRKTGENMVLDLEIEYNTKNKMSRTETGKIIAKAE